MTGAPVRVLAVDLGATSVRVVAVDLDAPEPAAQVLHRWRHLPVRHQDGSLRWDWQGILREVERGLELGMATGPVASIGVDGWGVDYGLLDGRGALLSPPYCYRDDRTEGWRRTAERIVLITLARWVCSVPCQPRREKAGKMSCGEPTNTRLSGSALPSPC